MGEVIFQIMAILKAMEVNVLREHTVKGLEAARIEGRVGGRSTIYQYLRREGVVIKGFKKLKNK